MSFWREDPPPVIVYPPEPLPEQSNDGWLIATQPDPLSAVLELRQGASTDPTWSAMSDRPLVRMHLGLRKEPSGNWMEPGKWAWQWSEPQSHILAVGPPRTKSGKTASMMIPIVLSQIGPVVCASTKRDIMDETSMARAQHGQLWCFSVDGDRVNIPDGIKQLRWSPLVGAQDWDVARSMAESLAQTVAPKTGSSSDASLWAERGASMNGPIFHWAALEGKSMEQVVDVILDANPQELGQIADRLDEHGSKRAAKSLRSIAGLYAEGFGSISLNSQQAIKAYMSDAVLAQTEKTNFKPEDFVRSGEYGCRHDTIYIVAPEDEQENAAPLVVALLERIQKLANQENRHRPKGHGDAVPVTFVLDELYGLAPLPKLPALLTSGGSQGVLIAAAIQDLGLLKARWPAEAETFLTLFGHTVLFPGVRNANSLETISKLCGQFDRIMMSGSTTTGGMFTTRTSGYSAIRAPNYEVDALWQGLDRDDPDVALCISQREEFAMRITPYWKTPPWPQLLTGYLGLATEGFVPLWMEQEAQLSGHQEHVMDYLLDLPLPDLKKWRTLSRDDEAPWWQRQWAARYDELIEEHRRRLQAPAVPLRYRSPPPRQLGSPGPAVESSARWTKDYVPVRSQLGGPAYTLAEMQAALRAGGLIERGDRGGRLTRKEQAWVERYIEAEREMALSGAVSATREESEAVASPEFLQALAERRETPEQLEQLERDVFYLRAQRRHGVVDQP